MKSVRSLSIGITVATAVAMGGLLPAKATTFDVTFTGDGVSGSLVLTGSYLSSGPGGSTEYTITGITGSVDGEAVTGLSTWNGADNILYYPESTVSITGNETAPTYVDVYGLGWTTAGDAWNIGNYFLIGGLAIADELTDPGNIDVYTNISLSVTETPLPSTWTMMLIGLAGLGFVGYRRGKEAALPAAA